MAGRQLGVESHQWCKKLLRFENLGLQCAKIRDRPPFALNDKFARKGVCTKANPRGLRRVADKALLTPGTRSGMEPGACVAACSRD